jgi:hypothetical protein
MKYIFLDASTSIAKASKIMMAVEVILKMLIGSMKVWRNISSL